MLITILKKQLNQELNRLSAPLLPFLLHLSALTHSVFSPNLPIHHLPSSLCSLIFTLIAAICSLPASILPSGLFSVAAAAACMRSDRHLICLTVPLWSHYSLSWPLCPHLISAVSCMNTQIEQEDWPPLGVWLYPPTLMPQLWHLTSRPHKHSYLQSQTASEFKQSLCLIDRYPLLSLIQGRYFASYDWVLIHVTVYTIHGGLMMSTVELQRIGKFDLTAHHSGTNSCKLNFHEREKHF